MGNRTLEEKKNPGGKVEESNRYVYNESNQLTEAVLCDGRTTRKVCYTYDDDGNLVKEYSPTDNSTTFYQYTVESRLEAVYTGNAYNRNLQMAAAYDGDGNRVYQVNYNPDRDEDFSCYYRTYNNCDYDGTGIQLKVSGEVSPTEEELIRLIAPAGATLTSKYELIEYVNDVNREYVEVLVEQNINGRTDTTYTYGVDRISKELFNQTSRTSYYLYDPRGSVAGLADAKGHLTKTYQYNVTGELTYGSATYENEYTYNGESYNPNIQSQYLRARYYSVVTANFLTEDSCLGNINQPLNLNRYNYCISSYLNYVDPSGFEKIVISGGIDDNANYKYQFIETALLDINNLIKKETPTSEITWIIIDAGYTTEDDDSNLQKFASTADKLGINLVTISDKMEFINYINCKNIEDCNYEGREGDKITYVSVFSHGLSSRYSGIEENMLGFAHGIKGLIEEKINFTQSDIAALRKESFDNTFTIFFSCNAGTDNEKGISFAQAWSNLTGGQSAGVRNGRTDYTFINTSGTKRSIFQEFDQDIWDYVNGVKEKAYNIIGWDVLKPSDMWERKMEHKREREGGLGYSELGSLKYPCITPLGGDLDTLLDGGIWERGWTLFEPQK